MAGDFNVGDTKYIHMNMLANMFQEGALWKGLPGKSEIMTVAGKILTNGFLTDSTHAMLLKYSCKCFTVQLMQ
jgi:hypothetical protein